MRLRSGKRIGQSGTELTLAVVLSCVLHILIGLAAVFMLKATPKVHVPLYYQVMLVGEPAELTEAPPKEAPLPKKPKEQRKPKKAVPKVKKATPKKSVMPEIAEQKPKPAEEQPAEKPKEQLQPAGSGPVAVTTAQQDFKFTWYLALIREKIGQNWRPPPDTKDAKARVVFMINRSGWVEDVQPDAAHSSGTFGFQQAAIRAIRSSNPFPPLPEEFSKMSVEFSVDLMAE